jgi:hypothetical protein
MYQFLPLEKSKLEYVIFLKNLCCLLTLQYTVLYLKYYNRGRVYWYLYLLHLEKPVFKVSLYPRFQLYL